MSKQQWTDVWFFLLMTGSTIAGILFHVGNRPYFDQALYLLFGLGMGYTACRILRPKE